MRASKIKISSYITWSVLLFILTLATFAFDLNNRNATQAATGINKQITYQGKIADSSGNSLSTGSYNFKFELYDSASSGTKLWEETWTSTTTAGTVSVISGNFSVALGTSTSLSSVDFNSDSIFLQIYLDADSNGSFEETFTPRKRITSAPYAFNSDTVDGFHATSTATAGHLLALDSSAGMSLNSITTTDSVYFGGRVTLDASKLNLSNYLEDDFWNTGFLLVGDPAEISSSGMSPGDGKFGGSVTSTDGFYTQGSSHIGTNLVVDGSITLGGVAMLVWPSGSASSFWATTTDSLVGYPGLSGDYSIVIGGSATTSDVKLEVIGGDVKFGENLTVVGAGSFNNVTTTDSLYIGGTSVFNGLVSGAGFSSAWDTIFIATTTWSGDLAVDGNVTGDNLAISNWNTAYGWDNHATAGYYSASNFNTDWDTRFIATTTWSGNLTVDGYASSSNGLYTQGEAHIGGNLTVDGLLVTIAGALALDGDIIPDTGSAYDLGSTAKRWAAGYFDEVTVTTLYADATSLSGTIAADLTINTDNATADGEDSTLTFERGTAMNNAYLGWNSANDSFDFSSGEADTIISMVPATGNSIFRTTSGKSLTIYGGDDGAGIGEDIIISSKNWDVDASGNLNVVGATTTKMYASSNLFVATTTPWSGYELAVTGDGVFTGNMYVLGYGQFNNVTTTDTLYVGGYASSTGGLFTQGNGHFGGNLTIDGNATSSHFAASEICLGGDCQVSWPAGGSSFNQWLDSTSSVAFNSVTTTDSVYAGGKLFLSAGATGATPKPQIEFNTDYYDNSGNPSVSHIDLYGGTFGLGLSLTTLNVISGGGIKFYNADLSKYSLYLDTNEDAYFNENVYIGHTTTNDDDSLFFDNGLESLTWDDSPGEFDLSDDLRVVGEISATTNIISTGYTSSTIGLYTQGALHVGGATVIDGAVTINGAVSGSFIGTDVQAYDSDLNDIAALSPTANYFMVGNGSSWALNSPANARIALGLGTTDSVLFNSVTTTDSILVGGDLTVSGGITLGGTYRVTWPSGNEASSDVWWATTTNSLIGYPALAGDYAIVIGASATTSAVRFEVDGASKLGGITTIAGNTTITGFASSTAGLYTQGSGHVGGGFTIDGNLGVGTTTPNTKFTIMDTITTTSTEFYIRVASTTSHDIFSINAGGQVAINTVANDAYALTIPNTGGSTAGTQTGYGIAKGWATYSDTRVKTDQEEINYGLKEILQMSPKRYIHHDSKFVNGELVLGDGAETIGLIAQEVFGIVPEAVSKPTDESESLWGIEYARLIPVIVKAIQELSGRLDQLIAGDSISPIEYSQESSANIDESGDRMVVNNSIVDLSHNLTVRNFSEFYGSILVRGDANFEAKVTFGNSITVEGKFYVSNDTAGTVNLPARATSTEVFFDDEYLAIPKIVLTPQSNLQGRSFWLSDKTVNGFRININAEMDEDINFDWLALARKSEIGLVVKVLGCTDSNALNYDVGANNDDGSCLYEEAVEENVETNGGLSEEESGFGCTDITALNYDESAIEDDGSCLPAGDSAEEGEYEETTEGNIEINSGASEEAPVEDSEPVSGCIDNNAINYNINATEDDGTCEYAPEPVSGCMDSSALNYSVDATEDSGSCEYEIIIEEDSQPEELAEDVVE